MFYTIELHSLFQQEAVDTKGAIDQSTLHALIAKLYRELVRQTRLDIEHAGTYLVWVHNTSCLRLGRRSQQML
jgi:hypothetical protein